jgi:hypothetical protein
MAIDPIDGKCCLACKQSFSEPAKRDGEFDKLYCVVCEQYVLEDEVCDEFNE